MNNLKVLFIDIDDVLLMHDGQNKCDPYQEPIDTRADYVKAILFYQTKFDLDHMSRIKKLTDVGVKLVIHSSWRAFCDLNHLKSIFQFYGIKEEHIIGKCSSSFTDSKKKSIASWLSEHHVSHHAIIDNPVQKKAVKANLS
jgi:hypothetical protein